MDELLKKIVSLVEPIVESFGVDLVDVELKGKPGSFRLSVYVDTADGISIDECVEVSKRLNLVPELDELLGRQYRLEVSSPGLDRPLRTEKDFRRKVGKEIEVQLLEADTKKKIRGKLIRVEEEGIELGSKSETIFVRYEQIQKAVQALPW